MDQLFVFVALLFIGLIILYLVIQAAIDNSRTAGEIKEIRRLLQQLTEKNGATKSDAEDDMEELENYEILDIPYDSCPACGAKLVADDRECKSCGLLM